MPRGFDDLFDIEARAVEFDGVDGAAQRRDGASRVIGVAGDHGL